MNHQEIISTIEKNIFDYSRLPKSPFLIESWSKYVFPMPMRLNEDEDYSCFSRKVIEAIKASLSNTSEDNKIYIFNYLVFGSELASAYPDIKFFWELDFTWENVSHIMNENLSYISLCIFDSSYEWMLISVSDEYSIFGCTKLISDNFEKNYKKSNCILDDFTVSVKNGHTYISEDVARDLFSLFKS